MFLPIKCHIISFKTSDVGLVLETRVLGSRRLEDKNESLTCLHDPVETRPPHASIPNLVALGQMVWE